MAMQDWVEAGEGVRRRVLSDLPELMVVEVAFEAGAEGAPHSHPHVQTAYVASGRFAFTVGGTRREVGPGETVALPSGVEHGCVALEAGTLIDSFSPRRDDFL